MTKFKVGDILTLKKEYISNTFPPLYVKVIKFLDHDMFYLLILTGGLAGSESTYCMKWWKKVSKKEIVQFFLEK